MLQRRSQTKILGGGSWGAKVFDFRWATVFCLGYRLSKHKMTRYAKNVGGMAPWALSVYAYGTLA